MFLMQWVLRLVNRPGLFPEKTRKDLALICEIDGANRESEYKDRTRLRKWSGIIFWKSCMWITYTQTLLFFLFFLAVLIAEVFIHGEEGPEFTASNSRLLAAFVYILLGVPLIVFLASLETSGYWKMLEPTPISTASRVLYRKLDNLANRLVLTPPLLLFFTLEMAAPSMPWEGTSFAALSYYYIKLLAISLICMSLLGAFSTYISWTPETKKGYLLDRGLTAVLGVPFALYVGIIFAAIFGRPRFLQDAIYLFYPLILHFLFAVALVDYHGPLVSLVIILLGSLVAVKLEFFSYRHEQVLRHPSHRDSGFNRMVKKKSKELDERTWWYLLLKLLRERLVRKSKHGEPEFGRGIQVYFSSRNGWENSAKKKVLRILSLFFILPVLCLTHLMVPALSVFVLLVLLLFGDTLQIGVRIPFSTEFVRLLPQNPEELEKAWFNKLRENFLWVYGIYALPFALLILIPYEGEWDNLSFYHGPDLESALLVATILPLHLFSLSLMMGLPPGDPDKKDRGRSLQPNIYLQVLYPFLLLAYGVALLGKFDFLYGNLALSWLFHLLVGVLVYLSIRNHFHQRIQNYFHNCCFTRKRIPAPQGFFQRSWQGGAAFLLALILMAVAVLSPVSLEMDINTELIEPEEQTPFQDRIPYDTALIYNENETLTNRTLELDQSLIINATVRLENSSLRFTNSSSGSLGLYVLENGSLILENCVLSSNSSFRFEVYGNISIQDSEISDIWGSSRDSLGDGGLELHGSGDQVALIANSSFSNCSGNGIMAWKSELTILDSHFSLIGDDSVEAQNSKLQIENSSFLNCRDGFYFMDSEIYLANLTIRNCRYPLAFFEVTGLIQDSELENGSKGSYISESDLEIIRVRVRNCRYGFYLHYSQGVMDSLDIQDCRYGIWLYGSDPTIRNTTIQNIRDEALREWSGSKPKLENNDIQEVEQPGISDFMPLWLFYLLCAGIIVLTTRPFRLYYLFQELEGEGQLNGGRS